MNIKIRRFTYNDADIVSEIIRRNFLEVNIKDYSVDEMEKMAQMYSNKKVLELSAKSHFYVACTDDNVVGCGSIACFQGKKDESILLTIFVLPELQGKGIGTLIVKTLENDEYFLKSKRTELWASITACDFYRNLGYDYINGIRELNEEGCYKLEKFNSEI
ncbi:MAG: GNAT family N-acetyltransferase [Oscillospiraceae bacterium]|nr:GNAT family N-acetyltransferase [Oscillospiraceae bacterium]